MYSLAILVAVLAQVLIPYLQVLVTGTAVHVHVVLPVGSRTTQTRSGQDGREVSSHKPMLSYHLMPRSSFEGPGVFSSYSRGRFSRPDWSSAKSWSKVVLGAGWLTNSGYRVSIVDHM